MLLPMYFLIGVWGGPRREYASIKFFLYTLFGSILILIVMIGLYNSYVDPVQSIIQMNREHVMMKAKDVTPENIELFHSQLNEGLIKGENLVHTFNMVYYADAKNIQPGSILDNDFIHFIFGYSARAWAFIFILIGCCSPPQKITGKANK